MSAVFLPPSQKNSAQAQPQDFKQNTVDFVTFDYFIL